MQGQGRSKEGQRLVLLTASQNQVSTSNIVTASERLFQLTPCSESVQHLKFGRMNWNNVKEARLKAGVIL